MNTIFSWLQAARIPSQSYIFIPLLLGQTISYVQNNEWNWTYFILIHAFGLFMQLYIIFANDYADFETDLKNKTATIFSGGSRVLVQGKIKKSTLLKAAKVMALLSFIVSIFLSFYHFNYLIVVLCLTGLLLLNQYSYPPLKLSYRGGGELLQMLGVGLVLPIFGYLGQFGEMKNFPIEIFAFLLPINLSCAIATSLPDEPSDNESHKRTIVVVYGSNCAKIIIILLEIFAFVYYMLTLNEPFNSITIYKIPGILILVSLFFFHSKPGSVFISIFVFFSIAVNLSIQCILILQNLRLI
ncbi:MAG: prenyltransferase [Leptospira sp.]|nr:prenyltransferase [Leptospira sp.]